MHIGGRLCTIIHGSFADYISVNHELRHPYVTCLTEVKHVDKDTEQQSFRPPGRNLTEVTIKIAGQARNDDGVELCFHNFRHTYVKHKTQINNHCNNIYPLSILQGFNQCIAICADNHPRF